MDEQLKKQIEEFREKTEKFSKGEINVAEYKSFPESLAAMHREELKQEC